MTSCSRPTTWSWRRSRSLAPETWTVLLIAVSTAVRLALAALVPPLGDEAYHWHLGSQFHLSYDHPPLTYWLAAIGPRLAPTASLLFARLPFVLYAATSWGPRICQLIPVEAPSPWVTRNDDFSGYAGLDDALDRRGLLERSNLFVCGANYMDCGRLAWVLRGRLPVVCAGRWSVAKSYVFLPQASGWPGAAALLVSRTADAVPDLALTRPFFSRATPLDSVTVGRGAHQTILKLHLLEGMSRPLPSYSAPVAGWPACSPPSAPAVFPPPPLSPAAPAAPPAVPRNPPR